MSATIYLLHGFGLESEQPDRVNRQQLDLRGPVSLLMMFVYQILDNTSTHWLSSWFWKIDIEAFLNVHLGLLEDEALDIGTTSLLVLKVGNCLYMEEDVVDGVYYYSDNRSFGLQSIDLLLLHLQDANTWKKGFMFIDHSSANSAWEPTWICWRIHCEFGAHRWMSQ